MDAATIDVIMQKMFYADVKKMLACFPIIYECMSKFYYDDTIGSKELSRFTNLRHLIIGRSKNFPISIMELTQLSELSLYYCDIPEWIGDMKNIGKLSIDSCSGTKNNYVNSKYCVEKNMNV